MSGTLAPTLLALPYTHLAAMSDEHGLFEHAVFDQPRPEHGYCVDDVARALIVVVQEPEQSFRTEHLAQRYLGFLERAVTDLGYSHNRMNVDGEWSDLAATGDWWGRAIWAAGVTAAQAEPSLTRRRAMKLFTRLSGQRSRHLRAMVFAGLGAGEVLRVRPHAVAAQSIVDDLVAMLPEPASAEWPWPEPRLRYANGSIADAVLLAGQVLDRPALIERGLVLLSFLLDRESRDGHLSVTGTAGRGPEERGALFDQQPLEIAAIAQASARAFEVTGDERWRDRIALCWAWFLGDNDAGTVMVDLATGAGFDGLEENGRNENRGAESTIAALQTSVIARRIRADLARVS
ncbi:glycosyltransferase [Microbacteriaceae bacterium VKM Ac-2854]|nr:glycosyltransferase [Microbacteriaceae bacterium VKM Ac-2854]